MQPEVPISKLDVQALQLPLDEPESDGTLTWDSVTIVIVEVEAGADRGLGYTYSDASAATLVDGVLRDQVVGRDAMDVPGVSTAMVHQVRNLGRPGIASAAIAAVDNALWDLKARILGLPLCRLLGMARESVPVYASGGFTSYETDQLRRQFADWAAQGFRMMKMKVGREPDEDMSRVAAAREEIGQATELFVDANGAYDRKQALSQALRFSDHGVTWFEEPVSSDDLSGLRLLRDRGPAGMDIAAGEYGYDLFYFRRMLDAGAVDVLQVDVTRCGGITTVLRAAALAEAVPVPLSTHTAQAQHLHVACALPNPVHMEYFLDHARIESKLFDGVVSPADGVIRPDLSRRGTGLELKRSMAERCRVA